MVEKKRASEREKSTSTSAPAEPSTKMADGKMVLKVRTRSQMKQQGEEAPKPLVKKPKTAAKKRKLDSKKPKKPPTAFFYFLEDFRKEFKEQNPDIKSMRDIGKACGEKWKTMTYEEKVQYYDIAMEKRAEFDRATSAYTKRMESGQDQESEDGSEFDE